MNRRFVFLILSASLSVSALPALDPNRCAVLKQRLGTTDWCAELAKKDASGKYLGINYDNAINCLDSFEFNADRLKDTIDNVLKGLEFNVFIDVAMDTPLKKFQFNFDLRDAVRQIGQQTWCNEHEWSEALYDAFVAMNDGHTSFTPLCFRKFLYTQAFYPVAMVDEATGKTRYYVGGLPSPVNEQDKVHVGREILQIDGQDPYQRLWNHSQTRVGKYKDAGTRFLDMMGNMAWDVKNGWSLWPGAFASPSKPPATKSVSWTLAAGNNREQETISREWYINLPVDPFSNKADYFSNFCVAGDKNKALENEGASNVASGGHDDGRAAASEVNAPHPSKVVEDVLKNTHTNPGRQVDPNAVVAIDVQLPAPIVSSEGIAFFQLPDAKQVCVILLTTFCITGNKDDWRNAMASIMQKFTGLGCKKLVIDLTANGGGYLDLAWEAIAVLTPDPSPNWPMKDHRYFRDFRVTDLVAAMTTKAFENPDLNSVFKPQWLGDAEENHEFRDLRLIKEKKRSRSFNKPGGGGKVTQDYSEMFVELPVAIKPDNPLLNKNFGLKREDMVLVSSGDCGSACGLLYYHLHEVSKVKGAVLSAFFQRARTFAAFPITEVFTFRQIAAEAQLLGLANDPQAPKPFTISAVMRIPVREGWSKNNPNIMVEYKWTDADIQIDCFKRFILRPDNVWHGAAEGMNWVQPPADAGNQLVRAVNVAAAPAA